MGVNCSSNIDETLPGRDIVRKPLSSGQQARRSWIQAFEDEDPNLALLETLVDDNIHTSIAETVFSNGDRALHKAVREGKMDLACSLIVNCGAKINVWNEQTGSSPLIIATSKLDLEMIQLLLGQHEDYPLFGAEAANSRLENFLGVSAADIAAETTDEKLWDLLCPGKRLVAEIERTVEDHLPSISRSASPCPEDEEDEEDEETKEVMEVSEGKAGFVNKRKPDVFGTWQSRYLLVNSDVMGWATDAIEVDNSSWSIDTDKFNSYEYLNTIDRVEAVDATSQCEFQVHVVDSTKTHEPREYEFKADTPAERDEWVRVIERSVSRSKESVTVAPQM